MAIPLASAVRVPSHHRRFSLHGFDVAAPGCMAVHQIGRSNAYHPVDLADAFRRRARLRTFSSRVARGSRFGSRLSARVASCVRALAVARSSRRPSGAHSSILDREMGRFFHLLCPAHCDGTVMRSCARNGASGWAHWLWSRTRLANKMEASFTLARAPARDATDRRSISLELSLASFFPSHPVALRGG